MEVDLAILGAGGAGLALVRALDLVLPAGPAAARGLTVALVDPASEAPWRTWCFWDADGASADPALAGLADLATASWTALEVAGPDGRRHRHELDGLRYHMLEGSRVAADAAGHAARLGVHRVDLAAGTLDEGQDGVQVELEHGSLTARFVVDTRPSQAPPVREGEWYQHFTGHVLRTRDDVFDPGAATFMDFSAEQPHRTRPGEPGVAFAYVLPRGPREALVEYTVLGPRPWTQAEHESGLLAYLDARWPGLAPNAAVVGVERGVVPLSVARRPRRLSDRVFRAGTAGGATRASSGYTFAAMHRQARRMAHDLAAGRPPLPPRPYPLRHRWYDTVFLRALRTGLVDGTEVFPGLFAANPAARVLQFVDGATGLLEEAALLRTMPVGPMLRAAAGGET